jgi:hypothetical protein
VLDGALAQYRSTEGGIMVEAVPTFGCGRPRREPVRGV